jgi:hypothetical protein
VIVQREHFYVPWSDSHPHVLRAFPTFHFYRDSQRVAETRGANREGIRAEIQKHAPSGGSQAKEAMTTRLFAALQTVKDNTSFDEFCAAARTLLTFVSNVIAHPSKANILLTCTFFLPLVHPSVHPFVRSPISVSIQPSTHTPSLVCIQPSRHHPSTNPSIRLLAHQPNDKSTHSFSHPPSK